METDEPITALTDLNLPDELAKLVQQGTLAGNAVPLTQLLSHQRIRGQFFLIDLPGAVSVPLPSGFGQYSMDEINQLPKPVLVTTYLNEWLG